MKCLKFPNRKARCIKCPENCIKNKFILVKSMNKYSLDIILKNKPFINIEIEDDRVLLGAYEDGKIARKLFYINKEQLELLIKGLIAVNSLIK